VNKSGKDKSIGRITFELKKMGGRQSTATRNIQKAFKNNNTSDNPGLQEDKIDGDFVLVEHTKRR
jgi:hypothetical protein